MPAPAPVRLSKSKFVAGVQCLKRLYLQIYQPELAAESDDEQEARFEQGQAGWRRAHSRGVCSWTPGSSNSIPRWPAQRRW
jgi:hypothetical protein